VSGVRAPRVVRANRIGRQGSDPDRRIRHGPAPRRFWFLASRFEPGPLPVRALKRLRADPAVGRDGRGRRQDAGWRADCRARNREAGNPRDPALRGRARAPRQPGPAV